MRNPLVVLGIVLIKAGSKFVPMFLKLLKGKTVLGALSFGSYAVIFSWEFALVIMSMLLIHEGGHLWAMKRCGMKTKGIYLIPFVGGAAVAEDAFPTQKSAVFIGLMGPAMGLVLTLGTFLAYLMTGSIFLAAAAGWMALINLLNLMPINPLDGGRVMRAICFSMNSKVGLVLFAAAMIVCTIYVFLQGYWLFLILIGLGLAELVPTYRNRHTVPYMSATGIVNSVVAYAALTGILFWVMQMAGQIPGADSAVLFMRE